MNAPKDGGPAFPVVRDENVNQGSGPQMWAYLRYPGMSLRDYFAAHALIASPPNDVTDLPTWARWAYKVADAMLKERSQS